MSTHTPGPWTVYARDVGYVEGADWPEDEFLQFEVHGPRWVRGRGDFVLADARLIAAAPELLEIAKEALRFMGTEPEVWERARAAIAKATEAA